jgi:hypothetical protein
MSRIGCGAVRSFFVRVRRRHLLELNYGQKDIKVFLTVVSSNLLPSVLCSVRVSLSTDTEGTAVLCSCVTVNRNRRHSCALFLCHCQQKQKAQLCCVLVSLSIKTEDTAVLCSCVTVNRNRRHSCALFVYHCQQKQKAQLGHSTDRPHCGHISSCFRTQQNVLEASFHVFSVSFCVLEPSNLTFKDQP